jgi:hypothetical protein
MIEDPLQAVFLIDLQSQLYYFYVDKIAHITLNKSPSTSPYIVPEPCQIEPRRVVLVIEEANQSFPRRFQCPFEKAQSS